MAHTGHKIVRCSEGFLVAQCRCMEVDKPVEIVPCSPDHHRIHTREVKSTPIDAIVNDHAVVARPGDTVLICIDEGSDQDTIDQLVVGMNEWRERHDPQIRFLVVEANSVVVLAHDQIKEVDHATETA